MYSCSNEDNAAFADGLFFIPDSYVSLPFNMALLGVHKLVEPSDRKHNEQTQRAKRRDTLQKRLVLLR